MTRAVVAAAYVLTCVEAFGAACDARSETLSAGDLNERGRAASSRGDYRTAAACYQSALESYRVAHPEPDPGAAALDNNLAAALHHLKRTVEAERLFREALSIDEAALGASHPSVARDLSNLAALLASEGRFEEAERSWRRAVSIQSEESADPRQLGSALESLAEVCRREQRFDESESFFRRAARAWERALGAGSREFAKKLTSYAWFLRKMEQFATAEDFELRARKIEVRSILARDR